MDVIHHHHPNTPFFLPNIQKIPSMNAAAAAKLFRSCPTLCNPIDGSPPGSSVPGILQAKILEWVAIIFYNACMHAKSLQLCPTLRSYGQQPTRLLCARDSLGKNTGVGCHTRVIILFPQLFVYLFHTALLIISSFNLKVL